MQNFSRFASFTLPTAFLPLLMAVGCSQTAIRGRASATAPGMTREGQARIHGVSDPNAPFTLIDRAKPPATDTFSSDENASASCGAAGLQIYEAAASMNGDARIVRLAFKNRGTVACRMSGFPAIQLQDANGTPIASIAIRQTGEASFSGSVASATQEAGSKQPVEVVLRPGSAASFEIGWTSGEGCPLVSRFMVAAPAPAVGASTGETGSPFAGSFAINHPLNICNGELRVTALMAGGTT